VNKCVVCICAGLLAKAHTFRLKCSLVPNSGITPGMVPFKVVDGCDQPNLIKYGLQNSDPPSLLAMLTERFCFA